MPYTPFPNVSGQKSPGGGVTVKMYRDDFPHKYVPTNVAPIYQLEYSVLDGIIWYNLSPVDGSPFIDVARKVQVGGEGMCPVLQCGPGQTTQCDWHKDGNLELNVKTCVAMDINLWLC